MIFLPDNTILGDSNANFLVGTTAQDAIFGLQGTDSISGGEGIDALYGNADTDILYGFQDDDFGFGGQGNDLMFGGQGNDQMSGDDGNDTIYGDKGADILTGDIGADIFIIGPGTGGFSVPEADLIIDFAVGTDLIQLTEELTFADLEIIETEAGDTAIQDKTNGEIFAILQGVDSATVAANSFLPEPPDNTPIDENDPPTDEPLEPELPTIPDVDFEPPVIQAALANDTGVSGTDFVTSDPTVIGGFNDNVGIARLEASLNGGSFTTVFPTFNSTGNFVLGQGDLEFIQGGRLTDGSYTLQLRAVDTSERVSEVETVTFILDSNAPQITAGLANDTGDSNTDGVTADPTVSGTVLDDTGIVEFRAGFAGNLIDIADELGANGQFSLSRQDLEILQGAALVDDTAYTLQLEAMDQAGLVSTATISFTFDAVSEPPPEPPIEIPNLPELPDPEVIEDSPVEVIEVDLPDMGDGEEREVTADPGNILEAALDIAVSSKTLIYSEQVSATDLEDLYVFSVGASSNLMLSLNGLSHDADLFLLDSNGAVIRSSERLGISDEFITQPLTTGTYFIQVKALDLEGTDYNLNVTAVPRDPDISTGGSEERFGLFTDESASLIGLEPPTADPSAEAFRTDSRFAGIDGSGFATVIIDTGIDLDHPFFGPDTDGNGIADRIVYQYDFADNDADASDINGHGSNVSSIVASQDETYTGMAPGADIIHLKVFSDAGGGSFGDLEEALQWVVENAAEYNIASVNMSLGAGNFTEAVSLAELNISDELAALVEDNVIVVSAAGNSFFEFGSVPGVSYPAADPNSLAVGAVWDSDVGLVGWEDGAIDFSTGEDQITSFSQRHPELLDIFAPGAFITGANQSGEIVDQGGTSQASPHIAGIAVLAQELTVQELGRRLTFDEFNTLIQESGDTIFDGDDEDDNVTNTQTEYERVNVLALGEAILALADAPPEEPPTEPSLVRYDFAYLYDGVSSDYYLGYTYAEPGSLNVGTLYDPLPIPNEEGANGLYFVLGETAAPETAISGEVFVSDYADVDASNAAYVPYYFNLGEPSGRNGIGSELDFVATTDETTGAPSLDVFGLDFFAADVTTETFTNTQWTRADYFVNAQPGSTVNGDLEGDGDEDLVVANTSDFLSESSSGFSLLLNNGDGSFGTPIDFETDFFSSGAGDDPTLAIADFDGDGGLDVANAEADSNEILLYFSDGVGNYRFPATDRPILTEAADLDGDGSQDLLTIDSIENEFGVGYFGNTVSIYYNDGAGNFPQKSTVTVGEGVHDVTTADLDGDGDLDLATANERTDSVSVLFNRGSGTFAQAVEIAVGDRPVDVVADDFDGDGNLDLATANFGEGTSSVLLSNGDGTFAAAIAFDSGANPSTLSAADLDGDGKPDLIMRNSVFFLDGSRQGTEVTLLKNQGDGIFAAPESFTVGDIPQGLVVADFDNNSFLDFATSNFDSQDVTVYLQSA